MKLTVTDTAPREWRQPLSTPNPANTCLSRVTLAAEDWMDRGSLLKEVVRGAAAPPSLPCPHRRFHQHSQGSDPLGPLGM